MDTERPIRRLLQIRQGMMVAWTGVAPGEVVKGSQSTDNIFRIDLEVFLTDCMWGMKERGVEEDSKVPIFFFFWLFFCIPFNLGHMNFLLHTYPHGFPEHSVVLWYRASLCLCFLIY